MTIHTKTALIVLATLLLGMILGGLISGLALRNRPPIPPGIPLPDFFVHRFEETIHPDELQRQAVRKILEEYAGRFDRMNREHRMEVDSLMGSMDAELSRVLTKEQLERMKTAMEPPPRWREGPPHPPFRRRGQIP